MATCTSNRPLPIPTPGNYAPSCPLCSLLTARDPATTGVWLVIQNAEKASVWPSASFNVLVVANIIDYRKPLLSLPRRGWRSHSWPPPA
ncbi:hypothetical protein PLICRDRAFT_178440 [Plicaturopsis crispa FD-325 SS-3]|nr:hypothetical protein PLICRDRAFT_178440 [Plicaturopsis crispa FD-325 SS-3]